MSTVNGHVAPQAVAVERVRRPVFPGADVVPMTKLSPWAWAAMPELERRIRDFCVRHDTDLPADLLIRSVHASYIADVPNMLVILAIDDGQVIGHLLVDLADWGGRKVATIVQYALDGMVPIEVLRKGLGLIEQWARGRGCQAVQVLAISEELARAYGRFYGFRRHRVLMRKRLDVDGGG